MQNPDKMRHYRLRYFGFMRILVSFLLVTAAIGQPSAVPDLTGVWQREFVLQPLVSGELVIDAREKSVLAAIGGYRAHVTQDGDRLSFTLPSQVGEFRGRFTAAQEMAGDWIQPSLAFPYNQRYATPVSLSLVQPNVWRGEVTPLEPRVSIYLVIQRDAQGKLVAFFRNPQANIFGRNRYDVTLTGDTIALASLRHQLTGRYDQNTQTIALPLLDGHPPVALARTPSDADLLGFRPRPQAPPAYPYRPPISLGDGWKTGTLTEVGMDEPTIDELVRAILSADPADNNFDIQGLLIVRHGKLVFEDYFYGFDRERPHDMRSASKTFATVLAGVTVDRGLLHTETRIVPHLHGYQPLSNPDPRKDRITLRDLMTMTPGLACNDENEKSPGNEETMQEQEQQPDWYRYTLDLPMVSDPGGTAPIYCSASIHLVGGAVRQAAKRWLPEVFDEYVARALQFGTYHINLTPTGEAYMGGGMYVRPRDQVKLGQLYLTKGIWNGRRVISERWVRESWNIAGTFKRGVVPFDRDHRYGYAWHIHDLEWQGRRYRDYSAGGNGGQNVIVIPDLDMVIGITGGSYGEGMRFMRFELEYVPKYIIAAVRDR